MVFRDPNHSDGKSVGKLPLRWVLVVPFVLEIFAAVGLMGWLAIRNGQKAVDQLATKMQQELQMRIEERLQDYLQVPHTINQLNANALDLQKLDVENLQSWERHFWHQIQLFDNISYIQFGDRRGEFVGIAVYDDGSLNYQVTESSNSLRSYSINASGYRGELLRTSSGYDPRQRPWYQIPKQADAPAWTPVYAWVSAPTPTLAITLGQPYYDPQGNFRGILATDLTIAQIDQFLRTLEIGKTGEVFIIESSRKLIATSTKQKPFVMKDNVPRRLAAKKASDRLIAKTARQINQKFPNLEKLHRPKQVKWELFGEPHYTRIFPFEDEFGINWQVVLVVPESDFMAQIHANRRMAILICVLTFFVASGLGIVTARWIAQPILHLKDASQAIATGQFSQQVRAHRISELEILANAFNQMASQLQTSFGTLEQQVQERTEALNHSEQRFQLVVQSINDGIWDWHLPSQQVYFSPQWKSMLGYADWEIPNQFHVWEDLLHPDDLSIAKVALEEHLKGKTSQWQMEFRMRAKNGSYRWILSRAKVVERDSQGKAIRMVGAHTDITSRKEMEAALRKAKKEADAANQAKSELLASMSHELRTPLNGILGYTQILQRSQDISDRDRHHVRIISKCGTHLLTLVNDILDLSKIEAQKMTLHPEPFHLPAFLTGVAEMCRIKAQQKGITFTYHSDPDLPEIIVADEKRLRQVLLNLLGNAVKFTEVGGVVFSAAVLETYTNENHRRIFTIRFQVEDTGIGIPSEQIQQIFHPFEQVGLAKHQKQGTGLGLSLSQEIVRLMKGEIQVNSVPGNGSIFWFDLDLEMARQSLRLDRSNHQGKIIGYEGESKRLLVVDDRWENRTFLTNLLQPLGFEMEIAENAETGWQKAEQWQPHLILTDLYMLDSNGLAFLQWLQQNELLCRIPIIVSSASAMERDRDRAFQAGANDFLPKPVETAQLFDLLQKHLNLQWVYEQNQPQPPMEADVAEESIIPPPAEEIKTLYHLAFIGSFKKIQKRVASLPNQDSEFTPFYRKVLQLSRSFQEEELRDFLQQYLPPESR
jgi:PAS domain S-box-containing protein